MDKCFYEGDTIPKLPFELDKRSNQMKTNEGVNL